MRIKILILLALMLLPVLNSCALQPKTLTAQEMSKMIKKDKKVVLLDVRTPEEYAKGHIAGAKNYTLHNAADMTSIGKLDKKAVYIVYCRTKNRSGVVANQMTQQGFTKVYQMTDGIVGWEQSGLPVVK